MFEDLRFAARTLLKNPGFAAAACLTLALGIGANTAVFSVVNAVLLKPLPYPEPERVVYLARAFASGATSSTLTAWKYDYFRRNTTVFAAVAAHRGWATAIGERGATVEVRGLRASAGFFAVNGIERALGRAFSAGEDAPGGESVVVLNDALWRERFDADAGVLGRTVELGGEVRTVVGVTPASFNFPDLPAFTDFIVPYRIVADVRDLGHDYTVRGRLAPGVTREQAAAELAAVSERFRTDHPDLLGRNDVGVRIVDFADVHCGRHGDEVMAAARRRGLRTPDRVRERREFAARALGGARARARDPSRRRRRPRPHRTPAAHRERARRADRSGARAPDRPVDARDPARARAGGPRSRRANHDHG